MNILQEKNLSVGTNKFDLSVGTNKFDWRGSRNFSKGGLRGKILKEKCLLITRTCIKACTHKTRQTCNAFSFLPIQEDCLLFFALFYYSPFFEFFLNNPLPPLDSPLFDLSVGTNIFNLVALSWSFTIFLKTVILSITVE